MIHLLNCARESFEISFSSVFSSEGHQRELQVIGIDGHQVSAHFGRILRKKKERNGEETLSQQKSE